MEKRGKKALSPLITTVLLVLVAIVLAVLIFLWARGFSGDIITKLYGGEEKDISLACQAVKFTAELSGDTLSVINAGDFPIYKFDLKVSGATKSATNPSTVLNLKPGSSGTFTIALEPGETLQLIPILLGRDKNQQLKEVSCLNVDVWQSVAKE